MGATAEGVRGRLMRAYNSLLSGAINPANWGTLLQRLYDGAATPIEQTSAITGSPMTVVNDLANTGDRRELRAGRVAQGDGGADGIGNTSTGYDFTQLDSYVLNLRFKPEAYTTNEYVLSLGHAGSGAEGIGFARFSGSTWGFNHLSGTGGATATNLTLTDSVWHDLVFTYSGGNLVVTDNGVEIANLAFATPKWTSESQISVLQTKSGTFRSTATVSDLSLLHNGSLQFGYRFEEEAGSVCFDYSGNGYHLTYTGTLADIHQPDTGVDYSAANSLGHTVADGSTMYAEVGLSTLLTAGTIIPRDESNTTKCVAYDSGGQVALQYSGSGPRYAQAIQSGALQGDGVQDHVILPQSLLDALESKSGFTLVSWCNRASTSDTIICRIGDGTSANSIGVNNVGTDCYIALANAGTAYGTDSAFNETGDYCIAEVFDGTLTGNANRLKWYINGQAKSPTYTGTIGTTTPATISAGYILRRQALATYATGSMWCVAFYSRALTSAEVLAIYETGTYPSDNLEALYPCSEINTAEGTVYDVSGNERHGTISGTVADVRAGRQDVIAWNQLHGFSLDGATYVPGFNGLQPDGTTATTYAPGATADKFTPDSSQIDRTGGVSHPDANVNSWDTSFESGDTQTNPEFVRNAAAGDDRFLAYQDTLTGDDLTSAQDYTT